MKQRKGFTLIELMIVIAIIIILAAIAIPNYLRMTERARRSRIAGDFASIATSLEAYSVDWGQYPNDGKAPAVVLTVSGTSICKAALDTGIEYEITGHANASTNLPGNTTLTGEAGGIDYIKTGTVQAMYNPFYPSDATKGYFYFASPNSQHWLLSVQIATAKWLFRSDMTTDLTEVAAAPTGITDLGAKTP